LAGSQQMRWYNPKLEDFEWREIPKTDEEALSLLEGFPDCERYAGIYREWRSLGAPITAALIRGGDAAREQHSGGASH
jgi:hypothetical protein